MANMQDRLYWPGNIAKTKIMAEILDRVDVQKQTIVFDYGCGNGGGWPTILADYPCIKLIGYEPYQQSFREAVRRLERHNAAVFTGDDLAKADFKADIIVSLSVFEHVYDRFSYLRTAKRLLANDGIFYLNYDDGHFRNYLDLGRLRGWPATMKELIRTTFSRPLAHLGVVSRYQSRVLRRDVDALVGQVGFHVLKVVYNNLASLKALFKRIPPKDQAAFTSLWLRVEDELNDSFYHEQANQSLGDNANLWCEMASRTLTLCHKK